MTILAASLAVPVAAQAPAGWQVRVDRSTEASDPDNVPNVKVATTAKGFRVTGGPAGTYWNSANRAKGNFTVRGTFRLMKPSGHTNYYGLIIGGEELAGAGQRYTYFLVAQDGTYTIRQRTGATVQDVQRRVVHSAVNQPAAGGMSSNTLEVRVTANQIAYVVNGTVVHTTSGSAVQTDGLVGVRINHQLDVEVEGFQIAPLAAAQQPAAPASLSREWYQQFSVTYSRPVEPFRIVGNIHYVGAANIASYLITTPQGHILIDTGMNEMHDGIRNSVAKLGFKIADVRIMLSSHAHFDHIEGHAAMQRLTGARVMAMERDAQALETGKDISALGANGWEPVKVDRVLKNGDTVSIGATTLRAIHGPGHTQGATTWILTVEDGGRSYTVAFLGGTTPNGGVPLLGNPRHRNVIEDTRIMFKRLKAEKEPDIVLIGHPQAMFAGKVERLTAGATPHPLLNGAEAWTRQIATAAAAFEKRVSEERAKAGS